MKWTAEFVSCFVSEIKRGSYMSAHVLLNLLNKLGKRDKMQGLPSILSHFWRKNVIMLSLCTQRYYGRHNVSSKSINH